MKLKKFVPYIVLVALFVCILGYLIVEKFHSNKLMSEFQDTAYGSETIDNNATELTVSNDISIVSDDNSQEETISNDKEKESVVESTTETIDEKKVEETDAQSNEVKLNADIDFDALQYANPDIFAWIRIPGTVIDYPLVQHPTNDEYYLKHGADGLSSSYGCPYIELCDSTDLSDFNTVVYGHNMNDGSMFAGLHKFEDQDFYNNHHEVIVTTADHVYTYEIFAAVMYCDDKIPYYYDDDVISDRVAFLNSLETNSVMERSIISKDVTVDEKSKIITLSTCDKKLRDNRFMVVAVLKQIDGVDI